MPTLLSLILPLLKIAWNKSFVYLSFPLTVIGRVVEITIDAAFMGALISSSEKDSDNGSSKWPKEQVPTIQRGSLFPVLI